MVKANEINYRISPTRSRGGAHTRKHTENMNKTNKIIITELMSLTLKIHFDFLNYSFQKEPEISVCLLNISVLKEFNSFAQVLTGICCLLQH